MLEKLQITDYEDLFDLWKRTEGMGMRSLDDSYEGIQKFLNRNPDTNFVYKENNQLIGAILCGHDGRRAYIYHAVVDNQYRGKGIGQKLVDSVIESLQKEGINKVCLVVFSNNEIGNGFWEKIGFKSRVDLNYRDKVINELNF